MTYEYLCTACGHVWEAEQSISAAPLTSCPTCQKDTAKRQVSGGAGFILKGGGWYADLYGSSKSSKKDESSASTTKSSDSTAEASKPKTETKTESSSSSTTSTTAASAS